MKLSGLVILLLIVMSTAGCGWAAGDDEAATGINEGNLAPDFALTTLAGGRESLSQYRGQPVMVNFFATWCGPCMAEMPAIQAVYQRYQPKGLAILGVDLNEKADVVARMRDRMDITFPLLMDKGSQIAHSYRTNSIPRTFYIDANGVIRRVIIGDQKESEITKAVDELFTYGYRIPTEPASEPAKGPADKPAEKLAGDKGITGCINIKSALVRSGPGSNRKVITQLGYQTCVRFDARSADGSWLRLSHKDSGGMRLWVTAEFISLQGDMNALAVAE